MKESIEESKEENKANLDEAVKKICDSQKVAVEQIDNDLNGLNINYLKTNRYVTRKMLHPYKQSKNDNHLIDVVLELCTLLKGVPYGLAWIVYTDPLSKENSFKGLGILESGNLNNSPFVYVDGYNHSYYISKMIDGRPAPGSAKFR